MIFSSKVVPGLQQIKRSWNFGSLLCHFESVCPGLDRVSVSMLCDRPCLVDLKPSGWRPSGTAQPPVLHLTDWCERVWSPLGENELLSLWLQPLHSWQPHLSLLSLHSVNSWNATLLRAHSEMRVMGKDSNIIRIFSELWVSHFWVWVSCSN